LPPKPDAKTPNFEQQQTSNLKNIKTIRELLGSGKDNDAVDIAVASGMKGPFGDPADIEYLRRTFGKPTPTGTLNDGSPMTPSPSAANSVVPPVNDVLKAARAKYSAPPPK
jgi:hypothetical protein